MFPLRSEKHLMLKHVQKIPTSIQIHNRKTVYKYICFCVSGIWARKQKREIANYVFKALASNVIWRLPPPNDESYTENRRIVHHEKWHIKSDFNFLVHSESFHPYDTPHTHPPQQTSWKHIITYRVPNDEHMNIVGNIFIYSFLSFMFRTTTITISG